MADYQILDQTGSLVFNSTYSRQFFAVWSPSASPYFEMWVKTAYSSGAGAASVRVNGTEIGKVWPRPWTNHYYIDLEAVPFIFPFSLLATSWAGPFGMNTLEVVPVAGAGNYLFVFHVIYHSRV
jgi:hypothetical protein